MFDMSENIPVLPVVFEGPPPKQLVQDWTGNIIWTCECGASGISSNQAWAVSDVNRHRHMDQCGYR